LRTREVEFQQGCEELVVGHFGGPAVGGEDGFVQPAVGEVEPGGPFVVEIGERAPFEMFRAVLVAGDGARIADGADAAAVRLVNVAVR
jgi:hypothetical protein